MAGIQIPRAQVSARLGRRAHSVDTSVAQQTEAAGLSNVVGVAGKLYDAFQSHQEATGKADMEIAVGNHLAQQEEDLLNATPEEQLNILNGAEDSYSAMWDAQSAKSRKGMLYKGGFDEWSRREKGINQVRTRNSVMSSTFKIGRKQGIDTANALIESGDPEAGIAYTMSNGFLKSDRVSLIAKADAKNVEIKEEAAYNSLFLTHNGGPNGKKNAEDQADDMVSNGTLDREEANRILNQVGSNSETEKKQIKQANDELQYNNTVDKTVGIWDGSLTDTDVITEGLRNGEYTLQQATSLKKMMAPPEISDLATLSQLNDDMLAYTLGETPKQEMLDKIIAGGPKVSSTDGRSLVNDLTDKKSQVTAKSLTDTYKSMERIIGSVTDITGNIVIGSDFEQVAYEGKKLTLDREVREAIIAEKPMTREDIIIRGIELAQEAKVELNENKRTRGKAPVLKFEKRGSYNEAYGAMNESQKQIADGLKTEGKTDTEILKMFNER